MTAIASAGVSHKILYGSDFPILSFSKYEKMMTDSGLSEEDRAKVLHGNAKTLLSD